MLTKAFGEMFGSVDDNTHIIVNEANGMVSIARICPIAGKVTTIGKWQKKLDERAEKLGVDIDSKDIIQLEFVQDGVAQFEYTRSLGEFVPNRKRRPNMRASA